MKLVLDACAYSDFAEGCGNAVDCIARNSEALHIPAIVMGELQYGFMKGSCLKYNEEKLAQFIALFNVTIIPVTGDTARHYAELYFELSSQGTRLPINDVWIAASCLAIDGTLLTRDRHFEHIGKLSKIIQDQP
jgi:tRNA(fMet)-specific endonuclease VapC